MALWLTLKMVVGPHSTAGDVLTHFAFDLREHKVLSRLVAVEFVFEDMTALDCFLQPIECFPALRRLTIESLGGTDPSLSTANINIPLGHSRFPALQQLTLSPYLPARRHWLRRFILPHIRELRCGLYDLFQIPPSCPSLRILDVRLVNTNPSFLFTPHYDALFAQLDHVRIYDAYPAAESSILGAWGGSRRRHFVIFYREDTEPPVRGVQVFDDLRDPGVLGIESYQTQDASVWMHDGECTRRLTAPRRHLPHILRGLAHPHSHSTAMAIHTVIVRDTCLPELLRALPYLHLPTLRNVVIRAMTLNQRSVDSMVDTVRSAQRAGNVARIRSLAFQMVPGVVSVDSYAATDPRTDRYIARVYHFDY